MDNFLGVFCKIAKIDFVMSVSRVCASVRPHGTTLLPPDGFL